MHRNHAEFVSDAHSSNDIRAEDGGKVVEYRHAGDIEQVLDRGGDAYPEHALDQFPAGLGHGRPNTDVSPAPTDERQHEEIQAGNSRWTAV